MRGEIAPTRLDPPSARSDFPIEFRLNYGPTVLRIRPREPFDIREKGERERRRVFLPNLGYPDAILTRGWLFALHYGGVTAIFGPFRSTPATEFGEGVNPIA